MAISYSAPGGTLIRVGKATAMEVCQGLCDPERGSFSVKGEERVSSSAAPGSGRGEGAPARPDARRPGRDLHSASSSAGSFSVAASVIVGVSHIGMETFLHFSETGGRCQPEAFRRDNGDFVLE
jgi:hypothetical protein